MLEARKTFLVPPADAEPDGELSVLGMRQARALGNALVDVPLRAVYAAPGLAAEGTAAAVAQRHGLVVRRRPALAVDPQEPYDVAAARVVDTFEAIVRVGPGRTSLLVVGVEALRIVLARCAGLAPTPSDTLFVEPASITEVTVEEAAYAVERLSDVAHLLPFDRTPRRPA
jgi:broad specificity phosphatase PhoE